MLKNHTFYYVLFSSLMAWRGEMLYAATRMRFFWNSQNIANLVFRFEDAAPDTQQTDQTMDQTMGKKTEKKKNKKHK